jgi:branched-chain amino acid transport system permease protein
MRMRLFWLAAVITAVLFFALFRLALNPYWFQPGYKVLQFIVLATAWNILGGYTGYVNFGTAAFFALGAYTTIALIKLVEAHLLPYAVPLPVMMLLGGVVSGVVGLGTGYLTLRLRGAFFSIATLALAVVAQTLITNWDFVGSSRGAYAIRPAHYPIFDTYMRYLFADYVQYLFFLMLVLAVISIGLARTIERSWLGYGLASIRDDEQAAEAAGVPTLRLKLVATTLSGMLMGMAGAPLPYYQTYLEPTSAFDLTYAVNSLAAPLIGGLTTWIGPLIGATILTYIQEAATVLISSAYNVLIVGVLLMTFVIAAPNGLVGLAKQMGLDEALAATARSLQARRVPR